MKSLFRGYYPPTLEELDVLWKEATIILDTNVLLNLYRLPASAREEFLDVLDLLKDRLWIPYQVALEFQRNRLNVIAAESKSTDEALASAGALVSSIREKVEKLQIEKRGLDIDPKPILDGLQEASLKLIEAIQKTHVTQIAIEASDAVRIRLDAIIGDNIGPGPKDQAELDSLVSDGNRRFDDKIPPGFADSDKSKNPNDSTYIHKHLKYDKKFGDLILWKQLLSHAKNEQLKSVLLVTGDRKDDWWWREHGKTIGAHPELISEINTVAGVELFWMYSSVEFLNYSSKYTTAKVSTESVEELRQVAITPPKLKFLGEDILDSNELPNWDHINGIRINLRSHLSRLKKDNQNNAFSTQKNRFHALEIFNDWLQFHVQGANIHFRENEFPDFVLYIDGKRHGFEVMLDSYIFRNLDQIGEYPALESGKVAIEIGQLTGFTLVLIVPEETYFDIANSDLLDKYEPVLRRARNRNNTHAIIVGSIVGGAFRTLNFSALKENIIA